MNLKVALRFPVESKEDRRLRLSKDREKSFQLSERYY